MFGLSEYHILLAGLGAVVLLSHWIPRFFSGREPASSALLLAGGAGLSLLLPDMASALSPLNGGKFWELTAEMCVIIGLFGVGLSIDNIAAKGKWKPALRLLLILMPATMILTVFAGNLLAGLAIPAAVLLAAVTAPTDPVLAKDVQVGPPTEGNEHPVRFALTTEAGLNDGLAFPFVYLGIALIASTSYPSSLFLEWAAVDIVYRIAVGAVLGFALGKALGHVVFRWPGDNPISDTQADIVALTGIILTYGITELAEGYGFIAVFVAGIALRREQGEDKFHGKLHAFIRALEHTLTAILLIALGAVMPGLLANVQVSHVILVLLLIFVFRPLAGWVSLSGTGLRGRARAVTAFYGIKGIGSVYYLAYAQSHLPDFQGLETLWTLTVLLIFASTVVHGLSAGIALARVTEEDP
jgi:sodium/hydrogen antiporter